MDLLKPFKAVKNKLVEKVKEIKKNTDEMSTLMDWMRKLENAKAAYNLQMMDEREYLYLGNRVVDQNINSKQRPSKYANNIYNIIFEMVESQVNTQIPQPIVKSKRANFEQLAQMIEDSHMSDLKIMNIEEINDINERITPVQGISLMFVEWDPSIKHQLYQGDYKVTYKHPKQLIPQPGIYNLQKMDYFFVLSKVTKEYVKKRYNVDLTAGDTEQFPEVNALFDISSDYLNTMNETVTEIVCWYKDEEGDIGKFTWTNYTVLEDYPKYFYRRLNKDGKNAIEKTETVPQDVQLINGGVLPAGTEVPYYVPKLYPVSVRINVPKNFSFHGQSDIDVIRDQQDSIKKVGTKLEEKIIKSTPIIKAADNHNVKITDEVFQVVKGNPQQLASLGVENLNAEIQDDITYIEFERRVSQWMLGITDSYQGVQDTTAQSGRAKQVQVQQAQGRLQSKIFNKYKAFKELFQIMFEFKLAFYDERRPFLSKDENGNDDYGEFDKYQFLIQDKEGQWYYNTDFLFSADPGQGLPKDPMFLYDQAQQMLGEGAVDKLQFWTIMEQLQFPQSKQIKDQIQQQMQQQSQQPQQNERPPSVSVNYKDMPPQAQQQVLAELGIQVQPQQIDPTASLSPQHQQMFNSLPPDMQQQILSSAKGGG